MDYAELEAALRDFALGGLRFFPSIGSSNDEALAWAVKGARDSALVVVDEQSSGRGRDGRRWYTPAGCGLAFSLVLRPNALERANFGRFSGLGALALLGALRRRGLDAQIKWPNDVLIRRKKVAGILVEAVWTGAQVDSLVLGMGVNVSRAAVPPEALLNFPATSVEAEMGMEVGRVELLRDLLDELGRLRPRLASDDFLSAWQAALAFRGEKVLLWQGTLLPVQVELLGLEPDGSLRVLTASGELRSIHFGEVHLRPG